MAPRTALIPWVGYYAILGIPHPSATGDVPNAHRPQIARGGTTRVWAEPETGGESYIPHANDRRRPGARSIAEQTVGILGGQVEWYRRGGIHSLVDTDEMRAHQRREAERIGVQAAMRHSGGGGYSGPQTVKVEGPLQVQGTLKTPWGPAKVEGIAFAAGVEAAQAVMADRDEQNFVESTRFNG